jgi:hypothetical protein
MNHTPVGQHNRPSVEMDAEHALRLRRETAELAKAKQEVAEGKGIGGPELKRLLDWFIGGDDIGSPARPAD